MKELRFDMQVLLPQERIEQDEELTYEVFNLFFLLSILFTYKWQGLFHKASKELAKNETLKSFPDCGMKHGFKITVSITILRYLLQQLLVLGMNLFLDGLNFHDQHRDMRMDIDNMSYEVHSII